ncbi:sensor histidine kinase [Microvirga thermotolerans]|uniref:histidine kinase n=1 Tax=Microvirga thermotolerans TaxID=2651334 RepID=A0A5P9K4I7_9HYPH|nr:HAMP domain-containing sensor histidine kinase [Microvirga thermotolerans]QFU17334.1 hypothetical protein GDR74_14490 [Microvirga thermotolerans]
MSDHRTPPKPQPRSVSQKDGDLARPPIRTLDRMALLAHQLVTPLSTISALAQGLMRRAENLRPEDVRDRGEKIWRASRRLQELIETIMSYTRANAGAITPNPAPFNLRSMAQRVCREQNLQQPCRAMCVTVDGLPDMFVGDPILLEQALVIVLSNAMKYSPVERPITVVGTADEHEVRIGVRDQGIGVPERDLPFLMQPFFRASNARHLPGTGLGLSLVRHILQLHGGSARIESTEGEGTTITLAMPRLEADDRGSGI